MANSSDEWSAWLDEHGPALVLLARQWVATRADAEDVVQEAFVRCWRSRDRVEAPAAYLFACVRHCALDWQRGHNRRQRRESLVARSEVEPLFTARIEQEERRLAVEKALARLPKDQAEVLVMKIWGGLTLGQIAGALETSVNTIASRYRYALSKLREQLVERSIL
jgi:RNA polymerase sigma-70 factor (ECF subfamily)